MAAVVRVDGGLGCLVKQKNVGELGRRGKKMGRKCGCLFSRQLTSCGNVVLRAGKKRRRLSCLLMVGLGSGRRHVSAGSKAKAEV